MARLGIGACCLGAAAALAWGCGSISVPFPDIGPGSDAGPDAALPDAGPPADPGLDPGADVGGKDLPGADLPPGCTGDDDCQGMGGLNECQVPRCDLEKHECVPWTLSDGTACGVPDACTKSLTCQAGACTPEALSCDDQNPCTDDGCDPLTGCRHGNNSAACNDGNPCTATDACIDGQCVGTNNTCTCTTDADCKDKDDGDRCNGILKCLGGDVCVVDVATIVTCPAPQDPCLKAVCDPATGQCGTAPGNDQAPCDDGNACSVGDRCSGGTCQGGATPSCDDLNPCTGDGCDPSTGCTHEPLEAACDDGNACTGSDACLNGSCAGRPVNCADANPCTEDGCDPGSGCTHVNASGACEDGDLCTAGETCQDGQCRGGAATPCDDGNPCTQDSCDPATGSCVFKPVTVSCEDGNACTTGDRCVEGQCVGGAAPVCDDGNPCTADDCNPQAGCVHVKVALPCDDASVCTEGDVCDPSTGACLPGSLVDCDDNNDCTRDYCDPKAGCQHPADPAKVGLVCDDHNPCSTESKCDSSGSCIVTVGKDCSDGNVCTTDGCDGGGNCTHAYNTLACDDGNACTIKDRCDGTTGACKGTPLDCDDKNDCTADRCVLGACQHQNRDSASPCDDANLCTTGDHCDGAGKCVGGGDTFCGIFVLGSCSAPSCDPATGCYTKDLAAGTSCNDHVNCTWNDACDGAGKCAGAPRICVDGDGNPCTSIACDEATGSCKYYNNTLSCDDGNLCSRSDVCDGGACAGTLYTCKTRENPVCDGKGGCFCYVTGIEPLVKRVPCDAARSSDCVPTGKTMGCYCGTNPQCATGYTCVYNALTQTYGCKISIGL